MAVLPIHKYFSLNGILTDNQQFIASENEGGVYEVIRIVEGIPLFLEDHLDRMYQSAKLAGKIIPFSPEKIIEFLAELIKVNDVKEGNVLLSCKINLKAFFISHSYPSAGMYKDGVVCGLLHAERMNPNAKVFQTKVREQANQLISEKGFYEVLLVDQHYSVTEGSRSNVFFVKDGSLITPPAGQVLVGITRQKTLQCATLLGLNRKEEQVKLSDLQKFDALCITGTSPKILPVRQVENLTFNAKNQILIQLMQTYDSMTNDYLQSKK